MESEKKDKEKINHLESNLQKLEKKLKNKDSELRENEAKLRKQEDVDNLQGFDFNFFKFVFT